MVERCQPEHALFIGMPGEALAGAAVSLKQEQGLTNLACKRNLREFEVIDK